MNILGDLTDKSKIQRIKSLGLSVSDYILQQLVAQVDKYLCVTDIPYERNNQFYAFDGEVESLGTDLENYHNTTYKCATHEPPKLTLLDIPLYKLNIPYSNITEHYNIMRTFITVGLLYRDYFKETNIDNLDFCSTHLGMYSRSTVIPVYNKLMKCSKNLMKSPSTLIEALNKTKRLKRILYAYALEYSEHRVTDLTEINNFIGGVQYTEHLYTYLVQLELERIDNEILNIDIMQVFITNDKHKNIPRCLICILLNGVLLQCYSYVKPNYVMHLYTEHRLALLCPPVLLSAKPGTLFTNMDGDNFGEFLKFDDTVVDLLKSNACSYSGFILYHSYYLSDLIVQDSLDIKPGDSMYYLVVEINRLYHTAFNKIITIELRYSVSNDMGKDIKELKLGKTNSLYRYRQVLNIREAPYLKVLLVKDIV